MKSWFVFILFFSISISSAAASAQLMGEDHETPTEINSIRSCILVFEANGSVPSYVVKSTFSAPQFQYYVEAKPKNLIDCLNLNAEEIVIIAHSFQTETGPWLGYYVRSSRGFLAGDLDNQGKQISNENIGKNSWRLMPATVMQIFVDEVSRRHQQNRLFLKRIRWASCDPEGIQKNYSDLARLKNQFNIEFDIAPTDPKESQKRGHPVTIFDQEWLKQSL